MRISIPSLVFLLASTLIAGPTPGAAATAPEAALAIELRPVADSHDPKRIHSVDITLKFEGLRPVPGAALLRLPLVASNVDSVATTLSNLAASDARGPIGLHARDVKAPTEAARDAESGGPSREWLADRMPEGLLTVRYSVPAAATLPPRGAAPPFSFSDDGGGVSAAGQIFLLLPPADARYRVSVAWDLAAAPAGSRGMSSLGEGRVHSEQALSSEEVRESFFMAGRIRTWPTVVPKSGFFAAWQGAPGFDAAELMSWTSRLYGHYAQFFGQKVPPPYGVFVRYNPVNGGGGVGLFRSFVLTYSRPANDVAELKATLAHEMFHTFQPYIDEPPGLDSSWFGEGLAMVYEGRLPLRFGLITPVEYLKLINFSAGRYYTSAMAAVPNSEVSKRFWADTRIRTLPYDRSLFYFIGVDDQVRKSSGGKRSLDDLMLAMLRIEHSGKTTSNADWEAVLEAELGSAAVGQFHAFLDGALQAPPSGAFGPCFERISKPLRRYEVGFDPAVLAEPKRIVRGLVAGSAAAQAGLQNGDEIVVPVPQDNIQGRQTERLGLSIRRDGREFPVSYLPRGETVEAYQWQRVAGVPDSACAL